MAPGSGSHETVLRAGVATLAVDHHAGGRRDAPGERPPGQRAQQIGLAWSLWATCSAMFPMSAPRPSIEAWWHTASTIRTSWPAPPVHCLGRRLGGSCPTTGGRATRAAARGGAPAARATVGVVQLDFDGVCRWLDDQLGHHVFAATQDAGPHGGNTCLSVQGTLARAEGDITLVDPRPGRIEAFTVAGTATLVLLEGDFTHAALGAMGEGRPTMVQATFRDLLVVVGALPVPAAS